MAARLLCLTLAAAVLATGCSSAGTAMLSETGPHAPDGIIEFGVPVGQSWSFGGIILCLSSPGTVAVTSVAVDQSSSSGRLVLEAFGVRPNPMPAGPSLIAAEGTLAEIGGFDLVVRPAVTTVCPKPDQVGGWRGGSELAVQVSRVGSGTAFSRALTIRYESGGTDRTYSTPFGISLCVQATIDDCPH